MDAVDGGTRPPTREPELPSRPVTRQAIGIRLPTTEGGRSRPSPREAMGFKPSKSNAGDRPVTREEMGYMPVTRDELESRPVSWREAADASGEMTTQETGGRLATRQGVRPATEEAGVETYRPMTRETMQPGPATTQEGVRGISYSIYSCRPTE
jgi:hypothetical protein